MSIADLERRLDKATDPSVGELITRYGTNLNKLKMDAAQGKIDPTKALMAKMAIDRIVSANAQPPAEGTVFQENMTPQAPAGLAAVPTRPDMFQQKMAGGGIVAMAGGGDVPRYQGLMGSFVQNPNPVSFTGSLSGQPREVDPKVLRAYYLSRGLPLPEELKTTEERAAASGAERGPAGSMAELIGVDRLTAPSGRMNEPSLLSQFMQRKKAEAMGGAPSAENPLGVGAPVNYAAAPNQTAAETQRLAAIPAPQVAPTQPKAGLGATPEAVAKAKATAPATEAATETGGVNKAFSELLATQEKVRGEKPTAQGIIESTRAFDKEFGVDRDFFKKQAEALAAQKDELKLDRKEAANMRLLEAGLNILGGESPDAFTNIGKGASKAFAGFADDIKDLKRQARDLEKSRQEVLRAEQAAARSDSAQAQGRLEKAQDKYDDRTVDMAKTKANLAAKMAEIGLQQKQVAQAGSSPTERIIAKIRAENPSLSYEQAVTKFYSLQQEPKTRAVLEREFLERPDLVKKYGTYDNYVKSTGSGGVDYKSKYGLD